MVETELCGKFMLEDGFCHMKRRMKYNELILMVSGEMYICEDDKDFYTVKEGDMLFLKSGRVHRGWKNSTGPVSFFWMHYTSDCELYNSLPAQFTPSETSYISQLYNQLFRYCKISREAVNCAATLLLLEAAEAVKAPVPANPIAEGVRAWIEANSSKNITVKKVADVFGYSPDYVSLILKELTGYTVKKYITFLRMDRAKELLLSTELNGKQISAICGYDDYKQFLKLFKKNAGLTPKEFRRVYRHNLINTV